MSGDADGDEEKELRLAALQTANSISQARKKAETELLAVQDALRESNERISGILESITDGFIVIDREWRFSYLNQRAAEVFKRLNRTRDDMLGKNIWDEFPDVANTIIHKQFALTMQQAIAADFEFYYPPLESWFQFRVYPGNEGISIYFQDITQRKHAEEQTKQQREWFRVTLSSIGDAVITTDTQGNVTFLNPIAETLTGWLARDADGQPLDRVLRIVNDKTQQAIQSLIAPVLTEGKTMALGSQTTLIAKDGKAVAVENRAAPIRDGGKISGAVIVFHDVAERRKAEKDLRASEERLRAVFNQAAVGIAVAELTGRFVEMNRKFTDILGYSIAELQQLTFAEITHTEDLPETRRQVQRLLAGEIPEYVLEKRYVHKSGRAIWSLTTVTTLRDIDGRPEQLIGVIEDITARRQMADALREGDRRKDEFLATLAHELRNPLAPIRHAAALLNSPQANDIQRRWGSDVIARQVKHMALLLDDLLDISRITRGRLELKREYAFLHALVIAAVETARPLIDQKQQQLTVELPDAPVELEVDPLRLSQVLSNLLTNASKYTDANGCIALKATLNEQHLYIAIKDNGIGLKTENIGQLFEMFSQIDSAIDRAQGGLGIGLALVKGLVELHGGRVEAHSAGIGRGSEFVVSLPKQCVVTKMLTPSATPSPLDVAQSKQRTILIVDDNRDAVESLAMILSLSDHTVYVAHSGMEALEQAKQHKPQAVILDIGMPGMSGYEVARRLRAEAWGQQMTIIAVTGWGQEGDRQQSFAAGINHHLTKPIDIAQIEALLATLN